MICKHKYYISYSYNVSQDVMKLYNIKAAYLRVYDQMLVCKKTLVAYKKICETFYTGLLL